MAVTDETLQDKRERLAKLRDQVATTVEKRQAQEDQVARDIENQKLDAEIQLVEVELARQKRIASRRAVLAGAETVLESAKEDEQQAKEVAKADAKLEKGK